MFLWTKTWQDQIPFLYWKLYDSRNQSKSLLCLHLLPPFFEHSLCFDMSVPLALELNESSSLACSIQLSDNFFEITPNIKHSHAKYLLLICHSCWINVFKLCFFVFLTQIVYTQNSCFLFVFEQLLLTLKKTLGAATTWSWLEFRNELDIFFEIITVLQVLERYDTWSEVLYSGSDFLFETSSIR